MTMKTMITSLLFLSLCGYASAQLAGSLDSSFASNGRVLFDMSGTNEDDYTLAAVELSNGMIMICGGVEVGNQRDIIISRLLPDGSVDLSFGVNGVQRIDLSLGGIDMAFSMAIAQDGDIVITGMTQGMNDMDLFVLKIDTAGSFDNNFGGTGFVVYPVADDQTGKKVLIQPDGKILVLGITEVPNGNDGWILRLNTDGTPDNSFSMDGEEIINLNNSSGSELHDIAILSTGEIFAAGYHDGDKAIIAKLNSDGSPDLTFGNNGILEHLVNMSDPGIFTGIEADASDRILACGYYSNGLNTASMIIRILPDGTMDTDWDVDGSAELTFQTGGADLQYRDIAITDGGILCIGYGGIYFTSVLLDSMGQMVTTFGNNGIAENASNASFAAQAYSVIPISNGRALIAGAFVPFDVSTALMMIYTTEPPAVGVETYETISAAIFPNPARQYFSVITHEPVIRMDIYNINGQSMGTYTETSPQYTLPAGITAGTYLLHIQTTKGSTCKKLYVFE